MEESDGGCYKKLTTTRGFGYSYFLRIYSLRPTTDESLPLLLLLHGFPTSSRLWRHQIAFFHDRGFSICAPDLLGFGESSKPVQLDAYRPSLVCKDIIEILDAEGFRSAIAIGHGLGSDIVSRLANLYPDHFTGYAFLAVPYCPLRPDFNMSDLLQTSKKRCGYELYGHNIFYAKTDADKLIQNELDSFFSAILPSDPKIWATDVAPLGALQSWLQQGKKAPIASYVDLEDLATWQEVISRDGIASALCWHKALVSGINAEDDKFIPPERSWIHQPVFFAAARHDYISPFLLGIAATNRYCSNATIREFNDGHWIMMSSSDKVNGALFSWIMDCI